MNEMNISFDAEKDKLVPVVGGYSHDNFFSLENGSLFPPNQSDDNLSDRFNVNETGHNIIYSSENGNSVESNQRRGNFNQGEISNLNDIVLIPLFTNKNTSISFKETKSTDLVSDSKTKATLVSSGVIKSPFTADNNPYIVLKGGTGKVG